MGGFMTKSAAPMTLMEEAKALKRKTLSEYAREKLKENPTEPFTILILGAGDSGKTTLFRNVQRLCDPVHFESESTVRTHRGLINLTIVRGMTKLVEAHTSANRGDNTMMVRKMSGKLTDIASVAAMKLSAWELPNTVDEFDVLAPDLTEILRQLWADPAVQETEKHESMLKQRQLEENVRYFMEPATFARVTNPGYVPTHEDILNIRCRTRGVREAAYDLNESAAAGKVQVKIIDVGGQEAERKSWVSQFEKAHVVFFVTAISDWDKSMLENSRKSRDTDSKELFKKVATCPYFSETPIILFLNKVDKFAGKLSHTDFRDTFKDFDDGGSNRDLNGRPSKDYFVRAIDFIRSEFEKISKEARSEDCMDDLTNVATIITCLRDVKVFDQQWKELWSTKLNEMDGKVLDSSLEHSSKYVHVA